MQNNAHQCTGYFDTYVLPSFHDMTAIVCNILTRSRTLDLHIDKLTHLPNIFGTTKLVCCLAILARQTNTEISSEKHCIICE